MLASAAMMASWPLAAGVAGGIALAGSPFVAKYQRGRALKKFIMDFSPKAKGAPRVHVIAHSFGTFLTANSLRYFPAFQFSRIVLVGSVLPRKFDWPGLLARKPKAFEQVRNEVGGNDWVVRLSGGTSWISRELGSAGRFGFSPDSATVHTVRASDGRCAECNGDSTPTVHNVPMPDFEHSDAFLNIEHALHWWLPFLWGFEPGRFREWVDYCRDSIYYFSENDRVAYEMTARKFRRERFHWTRNEDGQQTLDHHIQSLIEKEVEKLPPARRLTFNFKKSADDAFSILINIVGGAGNDCFDSTPGTEARRYLQPYHALGEAVRRAMAENK